MSGAAQPALFAPPQPAGHILSVRLTSPQQAKPILRALLALDVGDHTLVGLGITFVSALGGSVPDLRAYPALAHADGKPLPVAPADVWVSVTGADPAIVFARVRAFTSTLPGGLAWVEDLATFGQEDPVAGGPERTIAVAEGPLAGGSFVAAMRWENNLPQQPEPAEAAGPSLASLARWARWGGAERSGLYLACTSADLDAFEEALRQLLVTGENAPDALFTSSHPTSGGYFWCPPLSGGRLNLVGVLPSGGVDALPDIEVAPG